MKTLNQFVLQIGKVIRTLGIITLAVILVTITAGILFRYVFNNPLYWVEELASFLLVHLCFFSATVITIQHRHAAADFLISKAPAKVQKAVAALGSILAFVFFLIVCISIANLLPTLVFTSPALGIPRKFYYYPVFTMSAVMGFVLIVDLLNMFLPKKEPEKVDRPQAPKAALE